MRKVTDTLHNHASANGSDRNVARSSANNIFFTCITVNSKVTFVSMLNCLPRLEDVQRADGWASRTHYLLWQYLWTGVNYKELLTYYRHPLQRALDGIQARYCLNNENRSSCKSGNRVFIIQRLLCLAKNIAYLGLTCQVYWFINKYQEKLIFTFARTGILSLKTKLLSCEMM